MISFDRSLNDNFSIKIQCRAISNTSQVQVDRVVSIFKKIPDIIQFSNFYQGLLREQTMTAFPEKDWNSLGVKIKVEEEDLITQWPELMIYQKPWVLFGIVDLSIVDMETLKEEVMKFKRRALDEKCKLVKILLINGQEDFFKNIESEKQYIIVPLLTDDKLQIYLEDQLQIFLCDVVAHFAQEIQRLKNDQSQLVLFNMREEKINDQVKLKKRRLGRQYKMMADFALLVLSPQDAMNYLKTAFDILSKNSDYLWVACTQETYASAKFFERQIECNFKSNAQDPQKLNEEIEEHFREALIQLKKTKFTVLEIECFFRLMQFRKDVGDKVGLNKTVNLFLKTFDPESPPDKCKFYVFVSQLYSHIGMKRKEAFYLKLAANFITNINRPLCQVLFKNVATLYGIGQLYDKSQKNRIFWPSLQLTLAEEFCNFVIEWSEKSQLQIQIVQIFLNQYPSTKILQIFQSLNQDSLYSQSIISLNLPLIPKFVRMKLKSVKHTFKKSNRFSPLIQEKKDKIFIVNPWGKKKKTLESTFSVNQSMEFTVTLDNVFSFDFLIDKVKLEFEGDGCLNYPSSLLIPAGVKGFETQIIIKPLQVGRLNIKGIKINFLNYEYVHQIDERGYFKDDLDKQIITSELYHDLHNIDILEELPDVKVSINRQHLLNEEVETILFDETEVFTYQIVIENLTNRRIQHVRYDLCVESDNPPIYEYKTHLDMILDAYSSNSFVFVEEQFKKIIKWDENASDLFSCPIVVIPNINHVVKDMKKITLIFFFQFDDSSEYEKEIKLLRLIKCEEKIKIQQCRFISKYHVENKEIEIIKEIYDLQDSCYLSLELRKNTQDDLINLSLTSPILLEGQFTQLMTESMTHFSKVIKLRKLTLQEIKNESTDIYIIWYNLFRNTYGLLKPFAKLSTQELRMHCCKDLFEIEAKELNSSQIQNVRAVQFTINLNEQMFEGARLKVHLTITSEIGIGQNSQQSLATVTNKTADIVYFEIVSGSISFFLEPNTYTYQETILVYQTQRIPWGLKVELFNYEEGVGYIKRAQIK